MNVKLEHVRMDKHGMRIVCACNDRFTFKMDIARTQVCCCGIAHIWDGRSLRHEDARLAQAMEQRAADEKRLPGGQS